MPEPGVLLPAALGGLAAGGVYALLAAALALIQGKLRLIDFGQAAGLLLGVFGLTFLVLDFGLDPVASLVPAAAVGALAGFVLARFHAAPTGGDGRFHWIALLVIAEFWALQQGGGGPLGEWRLESHPAAFGFDFQPARALALFSGLLGCGLLAQTIRRTDFGRGVQASVAAGAEAGAPAAEHLAPRAFGLAFACLAAGACLLVPSNGVQVQTVGGFLPIVLALAVLGGRGYLRDALSGGLLIGLVEAVGRACLGDERGLLCVVAVALLLLLGHTDRFFPARAYFPSELQKR
jgi:branched-subunit amino acid ABC-type transport system permease component